MLDLAIRDSGTIRQLHVAVVFIFFQIIADTMDADVYIRAAPAVPVILVSGQIADNPMQPCSKIGITAEVVQAAVGTDERILNYFFGIMMI